MYYHVLLAFRDAHVEPRCVLADLSEKQLRAQFVKPYRRGKGIMCGNEIVELSRVNKVTIVRTADTSAIEVKRMQDKSWKRAEELNRTSRGLKFVSPVGGHKLEDIVEAGDDVTATYIRGTPGYGNTWRSVAAAVMKWIGGIATGLLVAYLVWRFGWG